MNNDGFDYGRTLTKQQQETIQKDKERYGDYEKLEPRFGEIRIHDNTLKRYPKIYQGVMEHLLVVKCEMEFRNRSFVIQAFSEWFEEIEPNRMPLKYQALVTEYDEPGEDGECFSIEFIREDITRQLRKGQWIA